MNNKYVFIMLGFVGSGKSYVSHWLTPRVNAVYLRADELRLAMFGVDRANLYTPENKALVNNATNYAMVQILKSNQANVVLDANHNATHVRRTISKTVKTLEATPVVVWVKTPLDIAKRRTEERTIAEGHVLFEPNLVEKMAKRFEAPGADELVIIIDGLSSAEAQQKSFDEQFAAIGT